MTQQNPCPICGGIGEHYAPCSDTHPNRRPIMNRGRPAGRMTVRRKQALERMTDAAASGERLSLARLAREIGVYDYKSARRIRDDLRAMNLCPGFSASNL